MLASNVTSSANRTASTVESAQRLVGSLRLWSLAFVVLLMATSYRLWLPPNWSNFPQVPALSFLVDAGYWCDYLGLAALSAGLLWAMFGELRWGTKLRWRDLDNSTSKWPWMIIVASGLWLVCLSQHRLQAWFFQLLLYCLVSLLSDQRRQLIWLQRIVVSIYVYSATGKLDFEFVHTVGQDFLQATASLLRFDLSGWNEADRIVAAFLLPTFELLLAGGLVWSKSRRMAGVCTCCFHLGLAALVWGPLNHSWGVFLWNLQFAGQAILLFVLPDQFQSLFSFDLFNRQQSGSTRGTQSGGESPVSSPIISLASSALIQWRDRFLQALLIASIVMPLGERWAVWDHWPSWALYAPHSSRVRVTVATYAVDQLPEQLRDLLPSNDDDSQVGVDVPLAKWSLKELGVPIYPQARFQLGVARYLSSRLSSPIAIQAEIRESADRFTGKRQIRQMRGSEEIQQASRFFTLGSSPRRD